MEHVLQALGPLDLAPPLERPFSHWRPPLGGLVALKSQKRWLAAKFRSSSKMAATLSKVLAPRFKLQKVGASLIVPSKLGRPFSEDFKPLKTCHKFGGPLTLALFHVTPPNNGGLATQPTLELL